MFEEKGEAEGKAIDMLDEILSYREMCDRENVQTLQKGMNFRLNQNHSVILMSRRSNAPYNDMVSEDGRTIIYEGHDTPKKQGLDPKKVDQPIRTLRGSKTQNGYFVDAVDRFKLQGGVPEKVRIYEKLMTGVWSKKGLFELIDYKLKSDGTRNVYLFKLRLSDDQENNEVHKVDLEHSRLIPSEVKMKVYKRDKGICVLCKSKKNIHFDHDLPFSLGGSSLTEKNIRILCAKCNLAKSNKIE